jgi:hypothetical protein
VFHPTGKQEKDPNESLNKSQEQAKPAEAAAAQEEKGGLFKRVSVK